MVDEPIIAKVAIESYILAKFAAKVKFINEPSDNIQKVPFVGLKFCQSVEDYKGFVASMTKLTHPDTTSYGLVYGVTTNKVSEEICSLIDKSYVA